MTQGAQARRLAVLKADILAANTSPCTDAWLPIKDASKDGKPFLLLDKWALETFGIPVIGHWEHDDKYAAGGRWVTTQGASDAASDALPSHPEDPEVSAARTKGVNMDMLAKAVELAGLHHAGQVDKAGRPYILHPLSVMHKVQAMTNSLANTETLAAAVMHDLIEDTAVTADLLLQLGFPFTVVELVQVLSRDKANESYQEFIDRVAGHSFAAAVIKMADIQDNIDVLRLDPQAMFDKDLQRLVKYRGAYAQLEAHVGSIWRV